MGAMDVNDSGDGLCVVVEVEKSKGWSKAIANLQDSSCKSDTELWSCDDLESPIAGTHR